LVQLDLAALEVLAHLFNKCLAKTRKLGKFALGVEVGDRALQALEIAGSPLVSLDLKKILALKFEEVSYFLKNRGEFLVVVKCHGALCLRPSQAPPAWDCRLVALARIMFAAKDGWLQVDIPQGTAKRNFFLEGPQ